MGTQNISLQTNHDFMYVFITNSLRYKSLYSLKGSVQYLQYYTYGLCLNGQ